MSIARESTNLVATDEIPVAIVQRLLSELTPSTNPKSRRGARSIKRAIQQASAKTHGEDFYVSTADFVTIAEAAGFRVEERQPFRIGQPVKGWTIYITPRSLDAFLQRHQVFPF